jgi:heme/copper-type cytochrome/quinol oxidase subunit 3
MSASATDAHAAAHPAHLAELPFGRAGMWWFLASEILVFGGLLGSYILQRIAHGGWAAEMEHLNANIAAFNTLVLVTSSLTIVQAHAAVDAGDTARARRFLWITVALGCLFLCDKAYEYSGEFGHGFYPWSSTFWSFYFLMTGLHGLHVIGGIVWNAIMAFSTGRSFWPRVKHRVEYAGLYWHFVDVVWIIIFPVVYLMSLGR